VWLIITAPLWGAIFFPAALGFGMVLFSIYWLWKSLGFASGVIIGFWRMHLAQDLLSSTDLGVAAIARRVGYDAEEAFSRAFKRTFGKSPGLWRADHALREV
jgi:AraC-like DNA-binding protein